MNRLVLRLPKPLASLVPLRNPRKGFSGKTLIVLSFDEKKLMAGLKTIIHAGTDLYHKGWRALWPVHAGAVRADVGRRSIGADGYGVAARNAGLATAR